MKKSTKIIVVLLVVAAIGIGIWYFMSATTQAAYDFAINWFRMNGDLQSATSGGGASQIDQCTIDGSQQGIAVSVEVATQAYYDWLAENGVALPDSITDRPGSDQYTQDGPESYSDRPGAHGAITSAPDPVSIGGFTGDKNDVGKVNL